MVYGIAKLFSKCVCLMPMKLRRLSGNAIGCITWLLVPKRRKRLAVDNVKLALGKTDGEARHIAKASWTRFGRMLMEVMAFPKVKESINDYVSIEGREYLDQALAKGNGAVLITAHSGNWELLGGALALNGYKMVAVAQKQTNAEMDRLINEYRELVGMHVTYKQGVREMIRLLSQGYIIGMLMDQDAGSDGVVMDFFSRPAACPKGPVFLARLKDAPLLPIFITEEESGRHQIIIKPAVLVERSENKDADITHATARLMRVLEEHISAYPKEWFWLHNRWKHKYD